MMKRYLQFFLFLFVACGFLLPSESVHASTNWSSNITTNTTWTTASSTYVLQNAISISSGATLTIEPGVVVKFRTTSGAIIVSGTLNAGGSAGTTYFTSYKDDSVGGNTDGATSTPAANDWYNIKVSPGGTVTLDNVVVRYGGSTSSYTNLLNYGGTLNVLNSVSASSSRYGIFHSSGTTNVATSTLNGNGYYGIYAINSIGTTTIANSTFYNNSIAAGYFDLHGAHVLSNSGNTATGTGKRGFIVQASSLGKSQTWQADTLPYIISSSGFIVSSGKTLTINPGTVIKFENSSAYLTVNAATLNAIGNSVQPIYFTSIKDDILNDTDNSATTTPASGDWARIEVNTSGVVNLSYATIRYGGANNTTANIYNNNGTFNISTSTISNAKYYGVKHSAGTTNLTQSSLFGNGSKAYYNSTYSTTTATNNYWGNASGPYNAKYNPSGTGNAVSDYVNFNPWLGQTHYIMSSDGSVDWDILHGNEILWGGTTQYDTEWDNAIDTWNDLQTATTSGVHISPDDIWHYERLTVSDVDNPNVLWTAQYTDYLNIPFLTDTIEFNEAKLGDGDTSIQIQNTCTHELGHALRLYHSYIGNVMYFQQTNQTALGTQDTSDYDSLW